MRKVYSIVGFVVLSLMVQACGQKGPLRLPDRTKPTSTLSVPPLPSANTPTNTTTDAPPADANPNSNSTPAAPTGH